MHLKTFSKLKTFMTLGIESLFQSTYSNVQKDKINATLIQELKNSWKMLYLVSKHLRRELNFQWIKAIE